MRTRPSCTNIATAPTEKDTPPDDGKTGSFLYPYPYSTCGRSLSSRQFASSRPDWTCVDSDCRLPRPRPRQQALRRRLFRSRRIDPAWLGDGGVNRTNGIDRILAGRVESRDDLNERVCAGLVVVDLLQTILARLTNVSKGCGVCVVSRLLPYTCPLRSPAQRQRRGGPDTLLNGQVGVVDCGLRGERRLVVVVKQLHRVLRGTSRRGRGRGRGHGGCRARLPSDRTAAGRLTGTPPAGSGAPR